MEPLSAAELPKFEVFPNPSAAQTTIRFRSAQTAPVTVQVLNALGQVVATVFDKTAQAAQDYRLTLASQNLPVGMYTCRLLLNGRA